MMLTCRFLLVSCVCFVLCGCHKDEESFNKPNFKNERYGVLPRNQIDIYSDNLKSETMRPLLLFVHGGGWSQFDKDIWRFGAKTAFFENIGFASAAINYTLSPFPYELNNPDRVQHPAHVRDLAQAIRWIVDNSAKYGIDKNKIFLMGHSSGAHMVCLISTDPKYLKEVGLSLSVIKGVISLDGGAYLTLDPQLMFPDDNDTSVDPYYITVKKCYYNAFGNDPAEYPDATPYNHIKAGRKIPPFLFISQGKNVPYRDIPNQTMVQKLVSLGIPAAHYSVPGGEHLVLYDNLGSDNDEYGENDVVITFLKKCLAR